MLVGGGGAPKRKFKSLPQNMSPAGKRRLGPAVARRARPVLKQPGVRMNFDDKSPSQVKRVRGGIQAAAGRRNNMRLNPPATQGMKQLPKWRQVTPSNRASYANRAVKRGVFGPAKGLRPGGPKRRSIDRSGPLGYLASQRGYDQVPGRHFGQTGRDIGVLRGKTRGKFNGPKGQPRKGTINLRNNPIQNIVNKSNWAPQYRERAKKNAQIRQAAVRRLGPGRFKRNDTR